MAILKESPKTHPGDVSSAYDEDRPLALEKSRGSLVREDSNLGRKSEQESAHMMFDRKGRMSQSTNAEKEGLMAHIAASERFMNLTLFVIVLNAMWIGVDTEWNHKDLESGDSLPLEPWSIVIEWFFCIYFSGELAIRFVAFEDRLGCWKDGWFVFDSILVAFMVAETWILPLVALIIGGGSGDSGLKNLSTLRIARLTRIVRMARSIDELRTLVKGMISAIRAVMFILFFLVLITYVFAIVFTTQLACSPDSDCYDKDTMPCHEIPAGEDPLVSCMFADIGSSMMTLFTNGMLGDNLYSTLDLIKGIAINEGIYMYWLFVIFFGMSALTLLNMLIGVLCDTVRDTATNERRNEQVDDFREKMHQAFRKIDGDRDYNVTRKEWKSIKSDEGMQEFLAGNFDIDVDEVLKIMEKMEKVIFTGQTGAEGDSSEQARRPNQSSKSIEAGIKEDAFLKQMIELRPDRKATPLDIEMLRERLENHYKSLQKSFKEIHRKITERLGLKPQTSVHSQGHEPDPPSEPPPDSVYRVMTGRSGVDIDQGSEWLQTVPTEVLFNALQRRAHMMDLKGAPEVSLWGGKAKEDMSAVPTIS